VSFPGTDIRIDNVNIRIDADYLIDTEYVASGSMTSSVRGASLAISSAVSATAPLGKVLGAISGIARAVGGGPLATGR
jgi:hypothetical protein